mgnify:CR=1 FL=1
MDLFSNNNQDFNSILPYDGVVDYYGTIMSELVATNYYKTLLNEIDWKADQALIFGKLITTKRAVAWYADEPFSYTYSKITKTALLWNEILLELKHIVESKCGETFNSCLLNLYHDESEGMAWHSDGEKDLKKHGAIASLSLGAERKFSFKHKKEGTKIDIVLPHGSLLVMKGRTQENWLHRLPPTKIKKGPRINLTFRTIEK